MNKTSAKINIRQLKSIIKCPRKQKLTLKALGLRRINHQVEHIPTPQILGMIRKIKHLVQVEEI
ncbi:50S ribosomal protein L30 [Bacteroidetes bacterium endosymbiont of Geopemphigus sp.]|uniref:50S ribosomal protein L30 n=1 Tax=Bacteroidetes bacterium endosymbiont of Geopemphigus sp. TaxID=2047937 RepID=UPI000CD08FC4|nr:50S ribosomal protein L30 [Bacteroidetes bacterium endosymbiont of Geopemphigus sp.]